ncbi:hypothetical protein KJE07_23760, partial [Escherichia marmotae]|nr:hypothetical protein [Escherichia marmotae]
ACCHPSTSVLLRNKWLTPPEDILEQVAREYERRIHNCPSFRSAYFHERRSLNNFHRDRVITFEQIAE